LQRSRLAICFQLIEVLLSLVFGLGLPQQAHRHGRSVSRADAVNHSRPPVLLLPIELILGVAARRGCQVRFTG